jgi:hypothetical protein
MVDNRGSSRRRRLLSGVVFLLLAASLPACGAAAPKAAQSAEYTGSPPPMSATAGAAAPAEEADGVAEPSPAPPPSPVPAAPPPPPPPGMLAQTVGKTASTPTSSPVVGAPRRAEMIIYTAQITMAVYQVETSLATVEKVAHDLNGYLASRNDNGITIRVPRDTFEEAIRRVALTGDVVHKQVDAEDVTDEFVDSEVRVKNLRAMRDRLVELLRSAAVKDALEIEKELGRITQEIERIEGRLKLLRDKLAYSTITVTFQARGDAALRDQPLRLPFPWLSELGLPRLLNLNP